MTTNAQTGADEDDFGSSTDQHVTGAPETGTFLTDQAPTAGTPAHGSGNAGVNATGGNRTDSTDDITERRTGA
jgi:hypothetical protein